MNTNPTPSSRPSRFVCLAFAGLFLLAAAPSARAQVVITTTGGNNYELTSVTVNSTTYNSWTNITVDSISAYTGGGPTTYRGWFIIPDGATQPAAADRMDLLEDNLLGTSIVGIRSLAATFSAPVVNNPGTDILLFDYGVGDTFDLTINSITKTIDASSFTSVISSFDADLYRTADFVALDTLAKWTDPANTFSKATDQTSAISVVQVDLSDYGVAIGASITSLSISDNAEFDPAMIIAIPEPSTAALLAGSLAALALLRRRRA